MSGLIIPTERDSVFLREVGDAEDAAWLMGVRRFTHPATPDQPAAPDHFAFRKLRQARLTQTDEAGEPVTKMYAGIWDEETFAGFVELNRYVHQPDLATVGCRLLPSQQGRGYGTVALRGLSDYAFRELNIRKLEARIRPHNQKSRNLAERAGFTMLSSHGGTLAFIRTASEF